MGEAFNEENLEVTDINDQIISIPTPMYVEVNFTYGLTGRHYQKVVSGVVVDIVDTLGNSILPLPERCEYEVVSGDFLILIP